MNENYLSGKITARICKKPVFLLSKPAARSEGAGI